MKKATNNDAVRAYQLRQKVAKGKPLTDDEWLFLDAYQKAGARTRIDMPPRLGVTRQRALPPAPPQAAQPSPAPESSALPSEPAGDEQPPPIDVDGMGLPPSAAADDKPPGQAPPPPTDAKKEPTESEKKEGAAIAQVIVGYCMQSNAQLRAEFPGAIVLPDYFFTHFMMPAATALAIKYVPSVDVDSELTQFAVVGFGAAVSAGQLHLRKRRRAEEEKATTSFAGPGKNGKPPIEVTPIPPAAPRTRSYERATGSFDTIVDLPKGQDPATMSSTHAPVG